MTPHLIIRIGSSENNSSISKIIKEHNDISTMKRTVFLGKKGRPLADNRMRTIEDALKENRKVKLYLAEKAENNFIFYAAPLYNILKNRTVPDLQMVPSYYRNLAPDISMWFEIGEFSLVDQEQMKRFVLFVNGRPLLNILSICRTPLMLIKE